MSEHSPQQGRKADEKEHKRNERAFWRHQKIISACALLLNLATVLAAGYAAIYAVKTYEATQEQANSARDQLTLARADQRPWIKVEKVETITHPIPEINAQIAGLRWWDTTADASASLPLRIELKNVGRSPAFEIRIGTWALINPGKNPEKSAAEQQARCSRLDKVYPERPMFVDIPSLPEVMFPNDTAREESQGVIIPRGDVKGDEPFQFWLYGCVSYRFSSSETPGQTPFAYRIVKIIDSPQAPGGKAMEVMFKRGERVPVEQIRLEPRPWASTAIK